MPTPSIETLPGEHTPSAARWVVVAPDADLRGDGPFALSANGLDVVVVRTAGGLRAWQGRCPHQGALLGEGELDGQTLVCRNHRWRFDAATGRRDGGPECLTRCPLEVRGGNVCVDPSDLGRAQAGLAAPRIVRDLADLPSPAGLPLIGNAHQIRLDRYHLDLERWAGIYGPLFRFRLGPRTIVVVADPAINEQVLRARPETYRRADVVETVFEEMGVAGVFSAEGAAWRPQRKLAMEALSHRHLRGFYPTLQTVTRRLRARWMRKAAAGATLDIAEELKRFTVDVTTVLTFGHDANTIEQEDDVIQRKLGLVFPAFTRRLFAIVPTWRWLRMPRDRRLDRALADLRSWIGARIAETRVRMEADPGRAERPENFLESMIAARDPEGRPFSDATIFGNAMTMLLAGEDTTAYTLAWAVHLLCSAPEVVGRLRAEADALLGDGGVAQDIESANRIVYAAAVANEAMRLRPVAPLLFFESMRDVVLDDVAVPKGTWIITLTRLPAVDGRNFVDPAAFHPERWIDGAGGIGAHEPSAHVPFGSGPRICPGRSLALLEMKVVLSMLLGSFEVERVGGADEVEEHFAFTMSPSGVRVRLHPRAAGDLREGRERRFA